MYPFIKERERQKEEWESQICRDIFFNTTLKEKKMDEVKKWYTSKTLWVSFLVFAASLVHVFGGMDIPVSPDAGWIAIALSIIQAILRLVTKEPVVIEKK
jgi:hypothetical protein